VVGLSKPGLAQKNAVRAKGLFRVPKFKAAVKGAPGREFSTGGGEYVSLVGGPS